MRDDTTLGLHPGVVAAVLLVCAAAGTGLGFAAEALFTWFEATFDGAPALLRAAAALPDAVTIVALGLVGAVAGLGIVGKWEDETMICELQADGVRTRLRKHTAWVGRETIASAYLDGDELVLADGRGRMLAAGKVDGVGPRRVARALVAAGYPWSGNGHPEEQSFTIFVDGRDDLGDPATGLIKARATALEDGNKARARELRSELSEAGVLVRDRRGEQEYVVLGGTG